MGNKSKVKKSRQPLFPENEKDFSYPLLNFRKGEEGAKLMLELEFGPFLFKGFGRDIGADEFIVSPGSFYEVMLNRI